MAIFFFTHLLLFLLIQLLVGPSLASPALSLPRSKRQCTFESAAVRKEWGSLTKRERKKYLAAVQCLQKLPSKFPVGEVPGAKTRFDDFTAVHINKTLNIHLDGIFLTWHRNFVWLYEKALQDECGYKGTQPYWNWALWANNLAGSPLFDGSDTSLSGDGVPDNSSCPYVVGGGATLPCGTGGGCVKSGPFKDLTTNLGPFDFTLVFTGLPSNWTAYNPHCLRRDLNNYIATRYCNQTAIDILMSQGNIDSFQKTMSGADVNLGVHGGGHFSLGPSLLDFFASPSDPAFSLHHSMIDRVYSLWQDADKRMRQYALSGTSTIFNGNSTTNVTLETRQDWGVLGEEKMTLELMDPHGYDFCYRYQ